MPDDIFTPADAAAKLRALEAARDADRATIEALRADVRALVEKHERVVTDAGGDARFARYAHPSLSAKLGGPAKRYVSNNILLRSVELDGDGNPVPDTWDRSDARPTFRLPGYLDDAKATDPAQIEFQDWYAARQIARQLQVARGVHPSEVYTPLLDRRVEIAAEGLPAPVRKAFVDTNGVGGEWIPTDTFPGIERSAQMLYERTLPGQFQVIEVARNITIPLWITGAVPFIHGVTGDDAARYTSTNVGTSSTTTALKSLAVRVQAGEDDLEESIVNNTPVVLLDCIGEGLVTGIEDAMINGDTTATHEDTGLTTWNPNSIFYAAPGGGSTDHRRAWKGLRRLAVDASNTVDRSTFSYATMLADRAAVHGPKTTADMLAVASELGFAKNVAALSQFSTQDVFRNPTNLEAVFVQGAGMTWILSRLMTDDLNASGLYDASTTDYTGMCFVNRRLIRVFRRYGIRLQAVRTDPNGIVNLVAKTRMDFKPTYSSDKAVRYAYKLAKS